MSEEMSEEEKKAIQWLREKTLVDNDEHGKIIIISDILLNLIEKQQEKIKNLLLQLKDSEKELLEVTQNIVNKEKIREKIQALDAMKVKGNSFITAKKFAISVLKELLEEE